MTKTQLADRDAARDQLRDLLPPGTTVYTILRRVSSSGMTRWVDVYVVEDGEPRRITWTAARAIGYTYDQAREAIKVGGCGFDVGFDITYSLAHALYPTGFGCIGTGCPSNDHSNGDRDYTPHLTMTSVRHSDPALPYNVMHDARGHETGVLERDHWHASGGYACNHRWL